MPLPSSIPNMTLVCISGPDKGKRLVLTDSATTLGRSSDCHLLSDDGDVTEHHLTLSWTAGAVTYRTISGSTVFLDGRPTRDGQIEPGQQLRVGRSYWQLASAPATNPAADFIERLTEQITSAAGLEKIERFNVSETFSEVFRTHHTDEIEDYLIVGTRTTTPSPAAVEANWPRPWLFFRAFILTAVAYSLFIFGWNQFRNLNLIPGLIMIGSLAGPFTLLIFFFEINVARNVSLYQVLRLMLIGGGLSLIVSLFGFQMTNISRTLGPPAAGIIEEVGKAAALLLVVNQLKYRWTLNGLLFGAAVGAGFAVFESAGYAFRLGVLAANSSAVLFDVIQTRGILSVLGGHVLWSALVGAALWRVRGEQRLQLSMLADPGFLRVFGLAVAAHMIWDMSFELPLYLKYIALGFVAWVALLSMIQGGLRQIKNEQLKLAATHSG
jgi:RsiW-degrading membrane proteinase PrsW (M82 family)